MTGPDSEGLQAEAATKNESPGPYSIGSDNWPGLAKLAEECGEVIQVIGKLIAMGGAENYDHWDGTQLRDRLQDEIADVLAAAAFVVAENDLDYPTIMARAEQKQDRFRQWHGGASNVA